jgi:hypothetical protein
LCHRGNPFGFKRLASETVFSLSIHADYRCRHSGKCCSLDWDVPVELPVYRRLTDALSARRLAVAPAAAGVEPFILGADLPDDAAAIFGRTDAGSCVFFDHASRLCIVHRDLGAEALALTCQHFPRVAIRDRRGTFVNLSHFCPTAAAMLFRTDVPLAIVDSPPAFPLADYDGLTVEDDDYPPLLRPRVLMDYDAYTLWEAHMVGRCRDLAMLPERVLATLERDARLLSAWQPGTRSLQDAVRGLPEDAVEASATRSLDESWVLARQCLRAVPPELQADADDEGVDEAFVRWVAPRWAHAHAPINRYIASKAFASWTAYQGRGVRTIVHGIAAAVALVRIEAARHCRDAARVLDDALLLEAFRSADFVLNHQAIGEELAANWGKSIGDY